MTVPFLAPPTIEQAPAPEAAEAHRFAFFAGATYLESAGTSGGALSAGVRLSLGSHLAASADLGYGLLGAPVGIDDRWWLIPSIAWVVPLGGASLDLGAGLGVGTVSGYASWSDYLAAPFTPVWHTTSPATRLHLGVAVPFTRKVDLFARMEAASLLASGTAAKDDVWGGFWVGFQTWL
jgi:hypothetical protein